MTKKRMILIVCRVNRCRSTIAEAICQDYIEKNHLTDYWGVDSAGVALDEEHHAGLPPHFGAIRVIKEKGLEYNHISRQITAEDFTKFDYILAMERKHLTALEAMKPASSTAKLELLGSYDPQGNQEILDPSAEDAHEDFLRIYTECVRSISGFFAKHDD